MRVWLAPSAFFPHRGGVEELTLQLARQLRARGHDVLVVAPRHPTTLAANERIEGTQVVRFAFTAPRLRLSSLAGFPWRLARPVAALLRLSRSDRPDVIHVQCPSVQLLPLTLVGLLCRVPVVITSQGETKMDAHQIYQHSRFFRWALRWCSKRAAALTACSTWTVNAAVEIAPRFADATVILNGIDPSQWESSALPEHPVVCAWGRHVPQKGFDLLIDAFKEVRRQSPDAELLLGGSGPDTAQLAARAGPGVTLVGALDRSGVAELLKRSRIAVVPSRLEPFGIVALEAMAAGRSAVWSSIGGLAEATQGAGRGVDPHDSHTLAQAILELLEKPGDPEEMRRLALDRSWERIASEYVQVYEGVGRAR